MPPPLLLFLLLPPLHIPAIVMKITKISIPTWHHHHRHLQEK
jgi:hypothetical protein